MHSWKQACSGTRDWSSSTAMRPRAPLCHRFSVVEYYRLAEAGILAPDARVELVDGRIYDMLPIGPFHSGVGSKLQTLFSSVAKGRWIVRTQWPIRLDDSSEPVPDLALVKPRADHYAEHHPRPPDVFLLIEVARRSLQFDRKTKLVAYARAGIQEYWIVNLKARLVEVYRGPLPIGEYSQAIRLQAEDAVAPVAFPDARITVADLF